MKVWIVEDDNIILEGLTYSLMQEGYQVVSSQTVKEAGKFLDSREPFDFCLLDIMLPDGTGYEICRRIRQSSQVPVLCLTACDDEVSTVMALEQGADDYIAKPFRIRELLARMKAVERRTRGQMAVMENMAGIDLTHQGALNQGASNQSISNQGTQNQGALNQGVQTQGILNQVTSNQGTPKKDMLYQGLTQTGMPYQGTQATSQWGTSQAGIPQQDAAAIITAGKMQVNLQTGRVYDGNREVFLTAMEYKLLLVFIKHRGQNLSRQQILDGIWDEAGEFVNDNTLSVYIRRLRGKLGDEGKNELIKTVRGYGYRMDRRN